MLFLLKYVVTKKINKTVCKWLSKHANVQVKNQPEIDYNVNNKTTLVESIKYNTTTTCPFNVLYSRTIQNMKSQKYISQVPSNWVSENRLMRNKTEFNHKRCAKIFVIWHSLLSFQLYRVAEKVSHCQIIKIVLNRTKACQWDQIYS